MKIEDIEKSIASAIYGQAPAGTRPVVEVQSGNVRNKLRKKRSDADASNFQPTDSIFIRFVADDYAGRPASPPNTAVGPAPAQPPLDDLIRALMKAESNPDHSFVSLKWFRDAFLPKLKFSWAAEPAGRQHWLSEAIAAGCILTDKLANPKNPEHPTTAIRCNRFNPAVARILGSAAGGDFGWTPVSIRGGPLSQTVREMRDERY